MDWVLASSLLFISSIIIYLLIRKTQIANTPNNLNNLFMFIIPTLLYLVAIPILNLSFSISLYHFTLILGTAIIFSYLGNKLSLEAIQLAPNPGYSLVLSKSYVVFTTIAAIFLLGSELTTKNAFAITLIVIFSALIMLSKKEKNKKSDFKWIIYSFGSFFCWGFLALMSKYILDLGISPFVYLFYLMGMVSIIILIETYLKKTITKIKNYDWKNLILIGIMSMIFNLFMQLGYQTAPNPGYINAVNAASIAGVTILSAYFFKDEFNFKKLIGVIGVIVGLFILLI